MIKDKTCWGYGIKPHKRYKFYSQGKMFIKWLDEYSIRCKSALKDKEYWESCYMAGLWYPKCITKKEYLGDKK